MTELALILFFALGVLLLFAGMAQRSGEPSRMDQVMGMYGPDGALVNAELTLPFTERMIKPLLVAIAGTISRFAPQKNVERTRHRLELAGNPNNWTVIEFTGVRGLVAVCTAALLVFLFSALHAQPVIILLFMGVGGVLGYYLPYLWLSLRIRRRQNEIQKSLPDALDLLTISVEAGLGFDSAMAKVAEQWDDELGRAFSRVLAEIRVGKTRREALRDMAGRMDVQDFSSFVSAIIQTDELGVPIANVLRIQSEQMRITRRQRAQEKANQAPIRMLFPLAFMIFPSVFIVLLGPAVIRFITQGIFK